MDGEDECSGRPSCAHKSHSRPGCRLLCIPANHDDESSLLYAKHEGKRCCSIAQ
jgi:hypothetical protein